MVEVAVKMDVVGSASKAEDDVYMVLKGKQNHLEFLDIQVRILVLHLAGVTHLGSR